VNEVLEPGSHRPDGLRASPWLENCGAGYLDLAFRTAAVADPKALLIWNENYLEISNGYGNAKRAAMLRLLDGMLARGVPVHGIGIEAHLRAEQAEVLGDAGYELFLAELARRGMKIFITELDVQAVTQSAPAGGTRRPYLGSIRFFQLDPGIPAAERWSAGAAAPLRRKFSAESSLLRYRPDIAGGAAAQLGPVGFGIHTKLASGDVNALRRHGFRRQV
jgi:hypothetical protein